MRFFDLVSLIAYNLARRKGRVALTAIGVVIGTAAVVLLVALASGLQRNATNQFAGVADLTIISVYPKWEESMMVEKAGGGGGGGGSGTSTVKQLTAPVLKDLAALEGVEEVIARDSLRTMGVLKYGRLENYAYIYSADTPDYSALGYELAFPEGSLALKKGELLIGESAMQQFTDPNWRPGRPEVQQPEDLTGQQIKMVLTRWTNEGEMINKTVYMRVAGVLKAKNGETDYAVVVRMDDLTTWNEWAMGTRINRNKEGYEYVMVKATDTKVTTTLAEQINEMGFNAYTPQSFVEGINNFYTIIQIVFGGIGAIALLVAAIGIANTMTMAILERTREIGLMKAVGATNRNVLSIFLGEAAGIGLIGGLGGIGLAWLAAQVVNVLAAAYLENQAAQMGGNAAGPAAYIAPWLPIFALIFSTLVGLISGLYPALRAATMIPVLALKYE